MFICVYERIQQLRSKYMRSNDMNAYNFRQRVDFVFYVAVYVV